MRRLLRLLLTLSTVCPVGLALIPKSEAAEPQFERVQLSSEFYSEGGTLVTTTATEKVMLRLVRSYTGGPASKRKRATTKGLRSIQSAIPRTF